MEMRFVWITDLVKIGNFDVQWHPGQENRADYYTKHFDGRHHQVVRPWYLHEKNSPRDLPRAAAPSALRGCVGNIPNGYNRTCPLTRLLVQQQARVPVGQQVRRSGTFPTGRAQTALTLVHYQPSYLIPLLS